MTASQQSSGGPQASPTAMLGLGFDIAVPVAILGLVGHWLDRWWGTNPWLLLTGLLLGMVVGFYNLWRRVVSRKPPTAGPS